MIIFLPTPNNRHMPCDAESVEVVDTAYISGKHKSHFATCARVDAHRMAATASARSNKRKPR